MQELSPYTEFKVRMLTRASAATVPREENRILAYAA
jgi:hypothetical protein